MYLCDRCMFIQYPSALFDVGSLLLGKQVVLLPGVLAMVTPIPGYKLTSMPRYPSLV